MSRAAWPWIQTVQATAVSLLRPKPGDFNVPMVAHSLGMLCRYNGHCDEFYSVAEHSVHCARIALKVYGKGPVAAYALMHDAHESVIGDISAPIKAALGASGTALRDYERMLERVFCQRFLGTEDMPQHIKDTVKRIDQTILMWEAEQIMKPPPQRWEIPVDDAYWPDWSVKCWGPRVAANVFHETCAKLKIK